MGVRGIMNFWVRLWLLLGFFSCKNFSTSLDSSAVVRNKTTTAECQKPLEPSVDATGATTRECQNQCADLPNFSFSPLTPSLFCRNPHPCAVGVVCWCAKPCRSNSPNQAVLYQINAQPFAKPPLLISQRATPPFSTWH